MKSLFPFAWKGRYVHGSVWTGMRQAMGKNGLQLLPGSNVNQHPSQGYDHKGPLGGLQKPQLCLAAVESMLPAWSHQREDWDGMQI